MAADESVHAFAYLDYRAFLRDLFAQKKAQKAGFSHRAFSRRAGLKSTNFLHLVISGQRNLTGEGARQFAKGFGLPKEEADYFCELVQFNQAKSAEERGRAYERLGKFSKFRSAHQLAAAQSDYHSLWYLPAIRELAARDDFQDDPRWIGKTLIPAISAAEAKKGLARLTELGLLVRDAKGGLRQATEVVTTGSGPLGHQVVAYHRAMMERASESIDSVPRDEREISSLTLCVSQDVLMRLKGRIREFRKELLAMAELEGKPERVVQLNFQLFPLSRREE